jgi:hypothetical protein
MARWEESNFRAGAAEELAERILRSTCLPVPPPCHDCLPKAVKMVFWEESNRQTLFFPSGLQTKRACHERSVVVAISTPLRHRSLDLRVCHFHHLGGYWSPKAVKVVPRRRIEFSRRCGRGVSRKDSGIYVSTSSTALSCMSAEGC